MKSRRLSKLTYQVLEVSLFIGFVLDRAGSARPVLVVVDFKLRVMFHVLVVFD